MATAASYPIRVCWYFNKPGGCRFGDDCRFHHVGQPGSHVEKKVCRNYRGPGTCPYGNRCHFKHVEPGLNRDIPHITTNGHETSYIPSGSVTESDRAIAQELQLQLNSEQDEQDRLYALRLHEEECQNRNQNQGPSVPQHNPFQHFNHPGHQADQNQYIEFDPSGQADDDEADDNDDDVEFASFELADEVRNCGASQQEINQLPVRQYKQSSGASSEAKQCQICVSEYTDGESVRTLQCLHYYHKKCIDNWLRRNAICPVCRISTKVDQHIS